jgi:hypothetical protein
MLSNWEQQRSTPDGQPCAAARLGEKSSGRARSAPSAITRGRQRKSHGYDMCDTLVTWVVP